MRKSIIILAALAILSGLIFSGEMKYNPLNIFKFLEGQWVSDKPGVSKNVQNYRYVLTGKYLMMKTRAEFLPTKKNPKKEIHEDFAVFSYDNSKKVVVMRGFYTEGFVNKYLMSASEDGKTLTFLAKDIENGMPGMVAKLIFIKKSDTEYEQSFYVKFPKKDYTCFFKNTFIKQKK